MGVFADEPIAAGQWIIDYAGELIGDQESRAREVEHADRGETWCFRVDDAHVRDANSGGNIARFINHSITPNCDYAIVGSTIWIRAIRDIAVGEELTYDYHLGGSMHKPNADEATPPISIDPLLFKDLTIALLRKGIADGNQRVAAQAVTEATKKAGLDPALSYDLDESSFTAVPRGNSKG